MSEKSKLLAQKSQGLWKNDVLLAQISEGLSKNDKHWRKIRNAPTKMTSTCQKKDILIFLGGVHRWVNGGKGYRVSSYLYTCKMASLDQQIDVFRPAK